MYYRGSDISHEYLFLNRNIVFKSSEFPYGTFAEDCYSPLGKIKFFVLN